MKRSVSTGRRLGGFAVYAVMLLAATASPFAALGQPISAIQKRLQDATSELALNKEAQAQPSVSESARLVLRDRAEVLTQTIARLKDHENPTAGKPRPPAPNAGPTKENS